MTLDPRSIILTDLRDLITNKRAEGFRPILMIDAKMNGSKPEARNFNDLLTRGTSSTLFTRSTVTTE